MSFSTGWVRVIALCLLVCRTPAEAEQPHGGDWNADWIGVQGASQPNMWMCFRKEIVLTEKPASAPTRIACDSKYWLWINGALVVFDGQLKRGPTPDDTYFDAIDLAPHLVAGKNTVAILVCYFGRDGYSHHSSGEAGLLFESKMGEQLLASDSTWKARVHPAFGSAEPKLDNVRLPEANLRFDARLDLGKWQSPGYDDSGWKGPRVFGRVPMAPWNDLYRRPIPQWKDSGLIDYVSKPDLPREGDGKPIICKLPYNCHVTPYLKVEGPAGKVIKLRTDIGATYGSLPKIETHRHEYITREGVQEFELPNWFNGHEVHYEVPVGVKVLDLKYRETGYDTEMSGRFETNDKRLNQLWEESRRTLYVTMRDSYMDCPDRERAQWWGDVANELGEAFYAFEPVRSPLIVKKGIYELTRWQRADQVLYSPVPSGIRNPGVLDPTDGTIHEELPQQMLASVGWYGLWTYYWYSGDKQSIVDAYPAVKRYLSLWQLGEDGLVVHRKGGWDWTDWGQHFDTPVVENAWLYLALKGAVAMAELSGNEVDVSSYRGKMKLIETHYQKAFWRGGEYRSSGHKGPTDDRANAMAVVSGLADPTQYPAIEAVLMRERYASPYMEKYVLEALMIMKRPESAMARMKERYQAMLDDNMTTLWEAFDPMVIPGYETIGRGTCNHAWSGGPLTILSQYVGGISPTAPAFREFQVMPQPGDLTSILSVVPTQFGNIESHVTRSDGNFKMNLVSPPGTIAVVGIPSAELSGGKRVILNGKAADAVGNDTRFALFRVTAGTWKFEVIP